MEHDPTFQRLKAAAESAWDQWIAARDAVHNYQWEKLTRKCEDNKLETLMEHLSDYVRVGGFSALIEYIPQLDQLSVMWEEGNMRSPLTPEISVLLTFDRKRVAGFVVHDAHHHILKREADPSSTPVETTKLSRRAAGQDFLECPNCGHGNPSYRPSEASKCLWVRCDKCGQTFTPPEAEDDPHTSQDPDLGRTER